ncbi:hypothetical protein DFA_09269 [Cavenderia fasciculata]|uniref:Uncharacterized protein n=1 Tax=Cavenderia fasciculata TaxID=261658 RepID=F4Q757_CACFS|nr:uncharacterized protein DFA_09269 [Cavenderia fasciculata]EGG16239.1 hypothetical protein DFA_09269 [Cavenderia fasciculata]|eukprot:XP_004354623.1 hypothetical protein DFA_09269 [Cavenderia fasciculata]
MKFTNVQDPAFFRNLGFDKTYPEMQWFSKKQDDIIIPFIFPEGVSRDLSKVKKLEDSTFHLWMFERVDCPELCKTMKLPGQ